MAIDIVPITAKRIFISLYRDVGAWPSVRLDDRYLRPLQGTCDQDTTRLTEN